MEILETRIDGSTKPLLLYKNKDSSGYQFINLEKEHICPCKFKTEEEALKDLDKLILEGKIKNYKITCR